MLIEDRAMMEGLLSFADVEERLVEAMLLCWRDEGGSWPFASDGPWHLIQKEWADYDARDPAPIRTGPMSRAEVAARDEAVGWLGMIDERDRRLVVLAIRKLAGGRQRVPWRELLAPMGLSLGADGLRRRYERALGAVVVRVNRGRRASGMADFCGVEVVKG